MASALASDPINQLEENLQCSVCLEVLTDPRTLPCCHSFCKDCLEGIVNTCRGKARGQPIREFPCPNCRATFILDPNKHVADMPRNHFICNMVNVAAVLDRGTRVPCSHNCNQSYSVARCVTCEKFLCRECLTIHNSYRGHNGHSVLTMEELSKPENRKKINDKMYCNEHSSMELKVYCETCDQLICRDCMDFKHVKQDHSCVLVKDEASKYKELLASNNKAMGKVLTEGNAFLELLTLTTEQLDRDAENAKTTIAQRRQFVAEKILEMLDQKAESLCKEVDEIHKGKRASLDKQTEETKLYVEKIKTSVEMSKKLVDQGTEEEIISSQKMMLDNAMKLLTKRKEYFKAPIPDGKLRYSSCTSKEPINKEILRGLANNLGEVYEEKKDAVSFQQNQSTRSDSSKHQTFKPDIVLPPCILPEIGEIVPVYISHTDNPSCFYVFRADSTLEMLSEEILKRYKSTQYNSDAIQSVSPGDILCAKFTDDGNFYRARVLQVVDSKHIKVQYVDFGNKEIIPVDSLRVLISEFQKQPIQAFECCLDGIEPVKQAQEWSEDAIYKFDDLTSENELEITVHEVDDKVLSVSLVDLSSQLDIAEEMKKAGFAVAS